MVEGRRKKQVVQGQLEEWTSVYTNILFYTELWPSLCLNLFGLDEEASVWIYSKTDTPSSVIDSFPSQVKWVSRIEASNLSRSVECDWVILQGSKEFVVTALSQELSSRKETLSIICLMPSQRIEATSALKRIFQKWYRLRHSDIGGVSSSSQWLIGLNYPKNLTHNSILPSKDWRLLPTSVYVGWNHPCLQRGLGYLPLHQLRC